MIDQPEVGLLAFAVRHTPSGPEWLVQCKVEPGNTHGAQLAPTVQATRSNLQRAHAGAPTPLTELVTQRDQTLLANGAWSEQGSRFIGKRNENRTVLLDRPVTLPDDDVYRWVPASRLRQLLRTEYAVNTDARSVLATGPWDLLASEDGPFSGALRVSYNAADRGIGYALDLLSQRRKARTAAHRIPLALVPGIHLEKNSATPLVHPHCNIHHIHTDAKTREVSHWDQPLVASHGAGSIVLVLFPDAKGTLRVRLTVDESPGLRGPEWTATIVDTPGQAGTPLPGDWAIDADVWCSDEGGRFDNCRNRVIIARTDHAPEPTGAVPAHVDLTLGALERLVRTPGTVTNELRTAVAVLLGFA